MFIPPSFMGHARPIILLDQEYGFPTKKDFVLKTIDDSTFLKNLTYCLFTQHECAYFGKSAVFFIVSLQIQETIKKHC